MAGKKPAKPEEKKKAKGKNMKAKACPHCGEMLDKSGKCATCGKKY